MASIKVFPICQIILLSILLPACRSDSDYDTKGVG